jgi:hypothetical protein
MAAAKKVVATQAFAATVRKVEYFVREGEVLPASHPAVKARPAFFADPARPK